MYELAFFYELLFFSKYKPFLLATLLSNPWQRFGCNFLPNPGNIAPFVRWNKQKERACQEMHFYDIKYNVMKDLTIKKTLQTYSFEYISIFGRLIISSSF